MLTFLLEEGVLTIGALSGIFTTGLLNSLKLNIIDPSIEKIIPTYKLDVLPPLPLPEKDEKSNFGDIFPLPIGNTTTQPKNDNIKWQTFTKDFITWLILMGFLYIFWKKIIQPNRISKMGSKN